MSTECFILLRVCLIDRLPHGLPIVIIVLCLLFIFLFIEGRSFSRRRLPRRTRLFQMMKLAVIESESQRRQTGGQRW